MNDRYGQNNRRVSRRKAGRPKADKIKLTILCFVGISPNTIPKHDRSLWSEYRKNNLIKQIEVSKTDNILEKIRREFNLNQGWKLYNVKSGKPIEVKDEINFESVKSNMTKKNRRLYIGPAMYDIISSNDDGAFTNGVSNRSSRSHVNGSVGPPVASTSTTENVVNRSHVNGSLVASTSTTEDVVNRSHTNGSPVASTYTTENVINHNGSLVASTSTTEDVVNRSHTNGSPVASTSTTENVINYNGPPVVSTSTTGNDINHSHTNGLPVDPAIGSSVPTPTEENCNTNYLILGGVKYILVRLKGFDIIRYGINLPTYTGTLLIGTVLYLVLPEIIPTDSFVNGRNLLIQVDRSHVKELPAYASIYTIEDGSYLIIPTNGFVNDGTYEDVNIGSNPFSNNNDNRQNYYTNYNENFILNGGLNLFQNR